MSFTTLCVIGTRPEAIKMAPVIKALQAIPSIQNKVCITGQHRQMLDTILQQFHIKPDYDLAVMTHRQNLSTLTAQMLTQLQLILERENPQLVLVQGDTTERIEAIEAGTAVLVGTVVENIVKQVQMLLMNSEYYEQMSQAKNPYG